MIRFALLLLPFGLQALEYIPQCENDEVRVSKIKLEPHEQIGFHRDAHSRVVVALKGGMFFRIEEDGTVNDVYFPQGEAVCFKADPVGQLHSGRNGDHKLELIVVELKTVTELEAIGKAYIDLLNQIGAKQDLSHVSAAKKLCAPHCKKIVNGEPWFEGVEHFVPQLLSTGETVGFWKLETLDIIPGKDGRTVVVRFLVHTEKSGVWTTFVVLRLDDQLQITEINEVFNSYKE